MDISKIKKNLSATKFIVPDQAFRFECNSLRPYTRYYVTFDQLDYTSFCIQDGKKLGEPLISDNYGKLNFTMHWSSVSAAAIQQNSQFSKLFDSPVGNKLVNISDKTGTSFINKTIFFTNNTPDVMFTKYSSGSSIVTT
jgi:hypothetical protein